MSKTIKRKSTRDGNVITDTYEKNKTRNRLFGGTVTKTTRAKTVTDLGNNKTDASGSVMRTVKRKDGTVSSKTKAMSPKKVISRGY